MGQPFSDIPEPGEMPDVGVPVQRPASTTEAIPVLPFREYMHQQADALRRGNVTVDTFGRFWLAAGALQYRGYDVDDTYVDPNGGPLLGPDEETADLLWRMRTPGAWIIKEEDAEDLRLIQRSFAGLQDELDERIPIEILPGEEPRMVVSEIAPARARLAALLGLANPGSFTLDQLAQKAAARLQLSDAVASGAFADLFQAVAPPRRRAIAVVAMQDVVSPQGIVHSEPLSRGGTVAPPAEQGEVTVPDALRVVVHPPSLEHRRRVLPGFDDHDSDRPPVQRTIRSHERPSRHLVRRAVAAVALTALMAAGAFFARQEVTSHTPSTPAIVKVDPRPAIPKTPVEIPPVQLQSPTDRIIAIGGDYNPVARTGAIWFSVEDYAAELGYSHLTMLQTHLLTDQCIQYMNSRVPGGMSWDQATRIASDAQLPYPPSNVMRTWISEVLAQTGATPNYHDAT